MLHSGRPLRYPHFFLTVTQLEKQQAPRSQFVDFWLSASIESHHGDARSAASDPKRKPRSALSATPISSSDPNAASLSWQTPHAASTDKPLVRVHRTQMIAVSFRFVRCASLIGPVTAHRHALSAMASIQTPARIAPSSASPATPTPAPSLACSACPAATASTASYSASSSLEFRKAYSPGSLGRSRPLDINIEPSVPGPLCNGTTASGGVLENVRCQRSEVRRLG
jgi:hypothetical protein